MYYGVILSVSCDVGLVYIVLYVVHVRAHCVCRNATFGNVTELVLSIAALKNGLLNVVADSLVGSILSNLLLVLGKLSTPHHAFHAPHHTVQ